MQPAVRVRPGQGGSQDSPSLYESKTAGKVFFATLSLQRRRATGHCADSLFRARVSCLGYLQMTRSLLEEV